MKVKVLSWNIWKGKHLSQIIGLLRKEDADIIGLQEVIQSSSVPNQAKVIAQTLGYHSFYCPVFTTDRHEPIFDIGNAFLAKLPISGSTCHILSSFDTYQKNAATEPRGAIKASLQIGNRRINFITTHLAYSQELEDSAIRIAQLNKLLPLLEEERVVLMGDFNSLPDSEIIKTLEQKLVNTDPNPTQASWTDYQDPSNPKYRIDYIFASKDLKVLDFQILESQASDHKPLKVELEI